MKGKQRAVASKSIGSNGTHKKLDSRGSANKNFKKGNKYVLKDVQRGVAYWTFGFDELLKKNDYIKLAEWLNSCNNIIVDHFETDVVRLPGNNTLFTNLLNKVDTQLSEKAKTFRSDTSDTCRHICVLTLIFLHKAVSKHYQIHKAYDASHRELNNAMICCNRLKNEKNPDWHRLCTPTLLAICDVLTENARENPLVAKEKLALAPKYLDTAQKYFDQAKMLVNNQEDIDLLLLEAHAIVVKRIDVMLLSQEIVNPECIFHYCNLVGEACLDSYASLGKHLGTPENIRNTVSNISLLVDLECAKLSQDSSTFHLYQKLQATLYRLHVDIAFLSNNRKWLDLAFATLLEKSIVPTERNNALRETLYAKNAVASHDLVLAQQHYQAALAIYRSLNEHTLVIQAISGIILCGIRDCNEEYIADYMDEIESHFRQQFVKTKIIDKTLKRNYQLITSLIDISQSFLWSLYIAAKNDDTKETCIQIAEKTHEALRLISQIIEENSPRTEVELLSSVAINMVHSKESKLMKIVIERQKETSTDSPAEPTLTDQTELVSEPTTDPIPAPEEELKITRALKKQYREAQAQSAVMYPYLRHCQNAFNEFYQLNYDAALHHLDICEGMTASRSENFSECCMIDCSILRAYININLTSHTRSLEKELQYIGKAVINLQYAINYVEKLPNYTPKQIVFFAKDPIAFRLDVIQELINLLSSFVENATDFMNHLIKITDEEKKAFMEADLQNEMPIAEDSNADLEFVKQKIEFYTILQSTCATLQSDLNDQKNRFLIIRQQLNQSLSDETLLLEFNTFVGHTQ